MSHSLSRWQAVLLGLALLVGAGLGVLALFTIGSRGWVGRDALHVRVGFPEIRGVEPGTRVRIQGMDAGEVVSITPPTRDDPLVLLRLRIEGKYRHLVHPASTVQIVSEGMLGNKVLEVRRPGPDAPGADEPAADNALLKSEPSADLGDVLARVGTTLKDIQGSKGTLGKLAEDPEAYENLVALLRQSRKTMASYQQVADGVKQAPVLRSYVKDPTTLLERPDCECNRKGFASEDLFEADRAVLTESGRHRLDELAPWLEGLKHKGSEVVVVSCADPQAADPDHALALTRQQSQAVCTYLQKHHAVEKMGWLGWLSARKVTPLGLGAQPSPLPRDPTLPPARVEIIVFVPQA